jgi:hypothetical protein
MDHHRDNEPGKLWHPDRLGFRLRSWTGWAAVASATSQAERAVTRPAGAAGLVVALFGVVLLLPGAAVAGSRWWVQTTQSVAHATHTQLLGVSCASERSCAAVGYSTGGGGGFVPLVERRHADRWSVESIPKPRGAQSGVLSAIACHRDDCTAVGYFADRAGIAMTMAERWNGRTWSLQQTANPAGATYSYLVGVSCTSIGSCVAVGNFGNRAGQNLILAEHWNGSRWSIQPIHGPAGAAESSLKAISCTSPTACTAVGDSVRADGAQSALVERWNGNMWMIQASPDPATSADSELTGVSCASPASCEAVGLFAVGGGPSMTLQERWDGSSWSIQPTPKPDRARGSELFGVACPTTTTCTAVGNFANRLGAFVTLAEHGTYGRWTIQHTPHPRGASSSGFDAVSCPSPRSCTAVGYFTTRTRTVLPLAERYPQPGSR